MAQLKQFISDNKLEFTKGQRNTNLTILVGFSLYNGNTIQEIKESIPPDSDDLGEIYEEIERLFEYCKKNHYENWWKIESNRSYYKL